MAHGGADRSHVANRLGDPRLGGSAFMLVGEYMTPEPFVIYQRAPVAEIVEILRRHGVHQVPVTDLANRLVGIVTDRDVRSAVGRRDPRNVDLLAVDIMTRAVTTVTPGTSLEEALDILSEERFGALPVVVGDHVVGILSARDLLKRFKELLLTHAATGSAGEAVPQVGDASKRPLKESPWR